ALAADAVDLGIGEADARQLVRRAYEEDLLDMVRRLRLDDDASGSVRRSGVAVDGHGPQVREVLDQTRLRGAHDVADRGGVLEAGDADHDVRVAQAGDLIADCRRQTADGHTGTLPPSCFLGCRARHEPGQPYSSAGKVGQGPVRVLRSWDVAAV